jgi:hypothetical protein
MLFYCLYQITNTINNKIYIGVHTTENVEDSYMGSGSAIKKAIKKHGKENFVKKILKLCSSVQELLEEEKKIVTFEFISRKDTYNLIPGGEAIPGFACKGVPKTLEHRKKISEAEKGKKRKKTLGFTGRTQSEFCKQKNREITSSRKWYTNGKEELYLKPEENIPQGWTSGRAAFSEEHRDKTRRNSKENWINFSEEKKKERAKKISQALKGIIRSKEYRNKISETLKRRNKERREENVKALSINTEDSKSNSN